MLYLFYGENSFFIRQKLAATKERYFNKYPSGLSFYRFDLEESGDGLETAIGSQSMFSEKRLLFLRGVFTIDETNWSSVERVLEKTRGAWQSEEVVLVFYDFVSPMPSLKKRLDFFGKNGQTKEFPRMNTPRMVEWVVSEAQGLGLKISRNEAAYLVTGVGSDTERLSQELAKLALHQNGEVVSRKTLDELVAFDVQVSPFGMVDALLNKNAAAALKHLEHARLKGEEPLKVLGSLVWQFRNMLKLAETTGATPSTPFGASAESLSAKTGLKPWTIKKTLAGLKNFSLAELKNVYQKLADADVAIKTGEKDGYEALSDFVYGFLPRKTSQ